MRISRNIADRRRADLSAADTPTETRPISCYKIRWLSTFKIQINSHDSLSKNIRTFKQEMA